MPGKLTWTMKPAGAKVQLTYRYENVSDHDVYINDGAVQQLKDDLWTRLTVWDVEQPAPDTALIYVGHVKGTGTAPTPGFFVKVPPQSSFDGMREVVFPLTLSGGYGGRVPLAGNVTKVAFAVEVIDGEPTWREVKTQTGPLRFPDAPSIQRVVADTKPMP